MHIYAKSLFMISYIYGDLLRSDTEALVNTVNCVGVMGRGIALQFKRAFPENYKVYKAACDRDEVRLGEMFVFERFGLANPKVIINFPTKQHWRSKSKLIDIERGLDDFVRVLQERGIRSVSIPALGCGLGGLDWLEVKDLISAKLEGLSDIDIQVFPPGNAPNAEKMVKTTKPPKWTPGRAILVALLHQYLAGLMDPSVSLLELHKLMYFAQEAGEPLQLNYTKAHYGPYAENLRHVLNRIEGHFLSGFADGGEEPTKELVVIGDAVKRAFEIIDEKPETQARLHRVRKLIDGFETPFGMELLASVHWVAMHEGASSAQDALSCLKKWSERKATFTPRQVDIAWTMLAQHGWLSVGERVAN